MYSKNLTKTFIIIFCLCTQNFETVFVMKRFNYSQIYNTNEYLPVLGEHLTLYGLSCIAKAFPPRPQWTHNIYSGGLPFSERELNSFLFYLFYYERQRVLFFYIRAMFAYVL